MIYINFYMNGVFNPPITMGFGSIHMDPENVQTCIEYAIAHSIPLSIHNTQPIDYNSHGYIGSSPYKMSHGELWRLVQQWKHQHIPGLKDL